MDYSTHNKRVTAFIALFLLCLVPFNPCFADNDKITGTWEGTLNASGTTLRIVFHINEIHVNEYNGTMDSPDQGVKGLPVSEIVIGDDEVRLEVAMVNGVYKGSPSEDFSAITGTWSQGGQSFPLDLIRTSGVTERTEKEAFAAEDIRALSGDWMGSLKVPGNELRIVFHIAFDSTGLPTVTLDSPDQGAKGIPASDLTISDGVVRLNVSVIGGSYEGVLDHEKRIMSGKWNQGGQSFPLEMTFYEELPEARRPQNPRKPYPYKEEMVRFENKRDSVTLAGTLTCPRSGQPVPAAVLISGSGAQDRDETIFDHHPFRVIADHLTRSGVAVLRYDDRGVGESTGNFTASTSVDFKRDVLAAVRFLKTRKEINPGKIGLIGHSEGGIIAPMAAAESEDIAFIILLAGSAVPGEEIIQAQTKLLFKAAGKSNRAIEANLKLQEALFQVLKNEPDRNKAAKKIRAVNNTFLETTDPEILAELGLNETILKGQTQSLNLPWMRFFLIYDPAVTLKKVKCPVLALNGSKDLQVPARQNLDVIAGTLKEAGHPDYTVEELPDLNHLFQKAETGHVSEYGKIEQTFSPVALERISEWIGDRFQKN